MSLIRRLLKRKPKQHDLIPEETSSPTPTVTGIIIPVELWAFILTEENYFSLSLVSKAFRMLTLPYLFRRLTISTKHPGHRFHLLSLKSFRQILSRHVKHLTLSDPPRTVPVNLHDMNTWEVKANVIPNISCFSGIVTLSLSDTWISTDLRQFYLQHPTLSWLELRVCEYSRIEAFSDKCSVVASSKLHVLDLEGDYYKSRPYVQELYDACGPNLQQIHVRDRPHFHWLVDPKFRFNPQNITKFILYPDATIGPSENMISLFQALSNVKVLEISSNYAVDIPELDVKLLPKLRELKSNLRFAVSIIPHRPIEKFRLDVQSDIYDSHDVRKTLFPRFLKALHKRTKGTTLKELELGLLDQELQVMHDSSLDDMLATVLELRLNLASHSLPSYTKQSARSPTPFPKWDSIFSKSLTNIRYLQIRLIHLTANPYDRLYRDPDEEYIRDWFETIIPSVQSCVSLELIEFARSSSGQKGIWASDAEVRFVKVAAREWKVDCWTISSVTSKEDRFSLSISY